MMVVNDNVASSELATLYDASLVHQTHSATPRLVHEATVMVAHSAKSK